MKPILIAGEWITTSHGVKNINPSDLSDVVDIYAQAGRAETQTAIEAATHAATTWGMSNPQQRHDILHRVGDEILARKEELGALLAREEGKVLPEAIGEVNRAGQIFLFFAAEALRQKGDVLASTRPGVGVEITREPIGVVGIIAPWNFPIAIPAWKIAPAICYGNTVVFKPAELVPGCAWALADILHRSGLPAGVFNLVIGPGSVVGQAMLDDPRVNAISFTGSQSTGARVAKASLPFLRKIQLEMGGKNPLVVLDDADLDVAVHCAVDGSFFSTGQRCTASSRLIVTEGIHDRFVSAVSDRLATLRVGHALDKATHIGPVVDANQLSQDLDYVAIARSQGGLLRFGGELVRRETDGHFLAPALITETSPDMRINREEVFGPVASVIRVRDYEAALHVANDIEFGLSAGICTTSLKHATDFKRKAQAGMVMVNVPTAGVDHHVPFGGRKASSYGSREQGTYASEFFSVVKTSYTAA
ncbi:aldehyde dehydrogenase family protein [Rhizobium leguminosarum]|uniref:aldehyde dehydrogenase family protein n=1 Tax=Rhizobium leguminosarum TaxID=384 RepID=UPI0013C03020|nr:aldehyde dehydrogenase family protein [Rhizobium leguminosarum]NEI03032.1 aldehyde dehydrogenase family protein [Rhizobium leguminosarum]NEJ47450.1 aldehyde dehydrogenase family protein [Rhizobium leguminosarum]NEJ54399.1 aldehyde dehydrogenase family protein [Rhizobium leguminosarum]NEJ82242.1 aldehyde dehydrogenase family protein [Rhizobium leguminosarum]